VFQVFNPPLNADTLGTLDINTIVYPKAVILPADGEDSRSTAFLIYPRLSICDYSWRFNITDGLSLKLYCPTITLKQDINRHIYHPSMPVQTPTT
jgi:hypothetical protein